MVSFPGPLRLTVKAKAQASFSEIGDLARPPVGWTSLPIWSFPWPCLCAGWLNNPHVRIDHLIGARNLQEVVRGVF